jgi:hypothetical protein
MGIALWGRGVRQRVLPFMAQANRRERWFKRAIIAVTVAAVAGLVGGTRVGRSYTASVIAGTRLVVLRQAGITPDRAEIQPLLDVRRARALDATRRSLRRFYRDTTPELRRLFDAAGMDPDHALVVTGRVSDGFVLSPHVFEADAHARSYRLRPGVSSVGLRGITLRGGPFGMFLLRDDPAVRAAAAAAAAIVDEPSRQTTNSWGLRGPEPDPSAEVRVVVLGDSFMQGMFNGDADTPPLRLEQALRRLGGGTVSVLNAGHIGYAPEQYFHTLEEYGPRFRPEVVVVSVCPNDFGEGFAVLAGKGDDWDEAAYWLDQIILWCRGRSVLCVLVPVPTDAQILGWRKDSRYPARVCDLFTGSSTSYCDPLNAFVDEHLRLQYDVRHPGRNFEKSPLYNGQIDDNHFSPLGADLWASIVAHRVDLLRKKRRFTESSDRWRAN